MNKLNLLAFVGLLLLSLSCKTQRVLTKKVAFDAEGHRGARGLVPENTIPSMLFTVDLGINTLEMDVHVSKDHKVVLSHDSYFNHAFVLDPEGKEIAEGKEDGRFLIK